MTSKNLFFNLQKEDLKRRIWTIALAFLVFFFFLPVICTMQLGNYSSYMKKEDIYNNIMNFMGPTNGILIFITVIAAIICGLSGFFYLHSKKKVDLYHSIPVRREVLYAVGFVNGFLIYIIPYVLNVILCFIVLKINKFLNMEIFAAAWKGILVNLLFFLLLYTIVIIAVMLTGNFIISIFGTAVFFLYGPMIMFLKNAYYREFFNTFYSGDRFIDSAEFLSPLVIYAKMVSRIDSAMNASVIKDLILTFVVTMILILLGMILYKKRPSEAAGKAMAFGFTKPIIKFLLVIPLTLGGGIIFKNIASTGTTAWFIFGLIFTLIIIYAIIEIIYNFDFRSAFAHKKQMLSCGAIVAIIVVIFQFDLLHYDSYVPKENKVESMSIAFNGLDQNLDYTVLKDNEWNYIDGTEYQLKYMELKDYNSAYTLAKEGASRVEERSTGNEIYFIVKYTLKSGKEVYRSYHLNAEEYYDVMEDIYTNQEFKEGHYPIYQLNSEDVINVSGYNSINEKMLSLDKTEINQLLAIYKEELSSLTFDQKVNDYPIGSIQLSISTNREYNDSYRTFSYEIYPAFEKTITFLKQHGFDPTEGFNVSNIKKVVVHSNRYTSDTENNNTMDSTVESTTDSYFGEGKSITYTDQQQIEEILDSIVETNYAWNNDIFNRITSDFEAIVVLSTDEYGNEKEIYYYFIKDKIPSFIKQDFNMQ